MVFDILKYSVFAALVLPGSSWRHVLFEPGAFNFCHQRLGRVERRTRTRVKPDLRLLLLLFGMALAAGAALLMLQ